MRYNQECSGSHKICPFCIRKCQDYVYVNESTKVLCKEYKALFETWKKVNENKVSSYRDALRYM